MAEQGRPIEGKGREGKSSKGHKISICDLRKNGERVEGERKRVK